MPLGGEVAVRKSLTRRRALLWEPVEATKRPGLVRCKVCERKCLIAPGMTGFCWNRENIDGKLYVISYGLLSAVESRPIEIKPLFHYWPGSTSLTFSGWGCNYRCPWCQNHLLSWTKPLPEHSVYMEPWELAEYARKLGDEGICASFNEPGIHFEYVADAAREARKRGLYAVMVTNGYFTLEALRILVEAGVDGYSIDIKGCPRSYRRLLSADPEYVLRNARRLLDMGAHVEMVYLMVTGANDSDDCVKWVIEKHMDILGPETPLHINRYHPANRYHEPPTPLDKLLKAYQYAKQVGLDYVYIGNTPLEEYEDTVCPKCGKKLIVRRGYTLVEYRLDGNRCPKCGHQIPLTGKPIFKPIRWTTIY